ncbi:MAG: nucleotide exchange factor GrpE [Deltaproteobacteria bacterium]|nr:nucleotide exchange factor GrpE [Deltaproteobacteria bacterium]
MRKKKEFLKEKLIAFQVKIAELTHALQEQENFFQARGKDLYLNLFEILDAFENLDQTMVAKESQFDKTTQRLSKNIRSIRKKLVRLLKTCHIVQIEFSNNIADIDYCKVVNTQEAADIPNETILSVVKNGYIDKNKKMVLRKAEVITVLNG